MARGHFNSDINPRLLKLIEGMKYDKYKVNPTSGYRPGDPRQHGRGQAIDIQLLDPQTQAALANYQDPSTFAAYQEYANALYQQALQTDPELAKQLRWGGYFSGGKGKYGALDLMHFDTAGDIGMGGGSWEGGLTPEQAKLWGLTAGGGVNQGMGPAMPAATYDYTPEQRRNAIAGIESAGSGDYAAMGPVVNRQGDRAYGRYQVMASNIPSWTKQALGTEMTPEQFLASPEAQDKVFDTIFGGYVKKHGEGNAATAWFAGEGNIGKDAKDQLGTSTSDYQSRYLKALGQPGISTPTPEGAAPAATPAGAVPTAEKTPDSWQKKFAQGLGKGLEGMGGSGVSAPSSTITETPKAALAQNTPTLVGGEQGELQRQKLAMMMAKLNSGKLWV